MSGRCGEDELEEKSNTDKETQTRKREVRLETDRGRKEMEREMVTAGRERGWGGVSAVSWGCAEEKLGRMPCVRRPVLILKLPSLPC